MVDQAVVSTVEKYLARVRKQGLPVKGVILYGSYARGDQRVNSDIDVLVIIDDAVPENEIRKLWTELGMLTIGVDTRIETVPVKESRLRTDDVSALIHAARTEGISIAA